jgi:hypothetical protein
MANLSLAWRIYRGVVTTGALVGGVAYAVAGGYEYPLLFFAFTLPIICCFCLVVGVPLSIGAVGVATLLSRACPRMSRMRWMLAGLATGTACVALALRYFLSVGALSNTAGRVFWSTLLVAGAISGMRTGLIVAGTLAKSRTHAQGGGAA